MRLSLRDERPRGPSGPFGPSGQFGADEPRREPAEGGEELLVARARAGDAAAFDALVRRDFARLHAFLFRLVGNHEDAEDLAQECFVRCHRALRWFRGEGAFTTWLYRIALHASRDHLRARGRRAAWLTPERPASGEGGAPPDPGAPIGNGPSDEAARRELVASLQAALARLPHRLRAAFVLRTFESRRYDEVARVLGITSITARVHVMKARRLLARWLEPWIDGRPR